MPTVVNKRGGGGGGEPRQHTKTPLIWQTYWMNRAFYATTLTIVCLLIVDRFVQLPLQIVKGKRSAGFLLLAVAQFIHLFLILLHEATQAL